MAYSLQQLQQGLARAEQAGDMAAVAMFNQQIQAMQNAQNTQQANQSMVGKYSMDQLKSGLKNAQAANDFDAIRLFENELANVQMNDANKAIALRESGSPVGAFFADMGATFSKSIPNLKKLTASLTGGDATAAQDELNKIEAFQHQLRTAFPSAVFGGEVAAPAAGMVASMPLGVGGAMAAGGLESAAFTPAQGNPALNAGLAIAAPLGFGVALKGVEKIAGALGTSAEWIVSQLYRTADDEAARGIRKYLSDAGIDPADVLREYQALGPNASLADTEQLRGVGQFAAMTPAGRQFDDVFAARQVKQSDRILSEAERILGHEADSMRGSFKTFLANRASNANGLYKEAYMQPFNPQTLNTMGIVDRLKDSGALSKARRFAKIEGRDFDLDRLNLEDFDNAKRGLDDMITKGIRDGNGNEVRLLTDLKYQLLNQLDRQVPSYAVAHRQFAGDSAVINAMELGKQLFRPKENKRLIEIADMQDIVNRYGIDEMAAFQQGAVAAIKNKLAKVPGTADSAAKLWKRPDMKEAIKTAFPDPDQFSSFLNFLGKESQFTDTWNDLYRGSQTAPRQAASDAFKTGPADVGGTGIIDTAINMFKGKLSPEGEQALARMMFDMGKPAEEIRAKMVESGIVPANATVEMIREFQENWPQIYRRMTAMDPAMQFRAAGALAPGAVNQIQSYVGGH